MTPSPDLLSLLLGEQPPPFAVLFRPSSGQAQPGATEAELMIGDVIQVPQIEDLPAGDPHGPPVLAIVPFRQLAHRGFEVIDDGAPLLALVVREQARISVAELLQRLPADAGPFTETGYDVADDVYARSVTAVLDGEIATGEGSNFVIHRAITGRVELPPARAALGALSRLLRQERQAYWTFAVHTPEHTFVGATPERHVALDAGIARMNPISGTLRHPAGGYADREQAVDAVLAFLADPKERDELWMVLDEELKMMAAVGDLGGRVIGPHLKEMAHLAHTEYLLEGRTCLDARQVLAATLFAPTVTGSPIRNAARVIARHEGRGRGYYGGVLALLDHDPDGRQRLDAPILIRTAHLRPDGAVSIAAGATLVRGSRPEAELSETRAKAAGILSAFRAPAAAPEDPPVSAPGDGTSGGCLGDDPRVGLALARRNDTLAAFWLTERALTERPLPGLAAGPAQDTVIVIDAEDDFTAMLAQLLRSLGLVVEVRPWTAPGDAAQATGPVVLGPGPGDPNDLSDERIAALHRIARARLDAGAPVLGICLGHQVLATELGLQVRRLAVPDQGVQRRISLFGSDQLAGFYNSFAAVEPGLEPAGLRLSTGPDGMVVAMRGPGVAGVQFHPESVLTTDGPGILRAELAELMAGVAGGPAPCWGERLLKVCP
jgi:2-amino-4-deoxychorismate synthase